MDVRRDYERSCQVAAVLFFLLLLPQGSAFATSLRTLEGQRIHSDAGSIDLRFRLREDIRSDQHEHALLIGVSADSRERYEIRIVNDKLNARRYFGGCLLSAFLYAHDFRVGDWHSLRFSWNGATTELLVDQDSVALHELLAVDDLGTVLPGVGLGRESSLEIGGFRSSSDSPTVQTSSDRDFALGTTCPNIDALIGEAAQENQRGIALKHFPDQRSRDTITSYLNLLPDPMTSAIATIVYVEDARMPKRGGLGGAQPRSRSLVLKGSSFSDPTVFFHEAAHLYDFRVKINFGVPEPQNEWAAISGVSCYKKATDIAEFAEYFQKTHVQNGILAAQGGQCASEDLAIWVGAVYDYYLKNKTFTDMMNPSSPKYSDKTRKKLDFLLQKGFFSQVVYDKVTSR